MTLTPDHPSESTPGPLPPRRMQLVGERRLPDPPPQNQTPLSQMTGATTTSIPPELMHRMAWKAGVMGALNVIAALLAARMIVLVSVSGGIALTWAALGQPDPWRLGALAIYSVAIVVPSVWLAARK